MATLVVKPDEIPSVTAQWFRIELDGEVYDPQFARKDYSITSKDNQTLRFELRDGEQHWWDAAAGHKSERTELAGKKLYQDGEAIEVSYGFKLEEGAPNTAKWMVLGQLHMGEWDGDEIGVPPPFRIGLVGEKMSITIGVTQPDGKNVEKVIFTDVYDIDRGHQYTMDVKAVFDADGNGRLIVTRDGVALVDYAGNLGYAQQKNVYWSQGIYRDSAATETVVAEYSNLHIKSGDAVQFPSGEVYVAAPKLAIASVGAAGADGSRHVLVTGTTKPGATVVIGDGTTVLATVKADAQGNLSADVKIPKGAETFLHATATDAAGNKGVPAIPITVEIGTAAEIVARLITLTDQGNVSAVVLTDTNVLTIPTGQLAFFMRKAEAVLDKIQGTYSFLETGKVTGQSYDRQDVAYTSDGVITERLRYSNGVLTYDEKIASDGSREVAARNSKGGTDVTQYSKDGTLLRVDQYDAAHKIVFSQVKLPDGGQETYTYNATTGVLTNHTVYNADKSKVVEELGIVGRAYDKQVYVYDAAGKLIQQDRVEPDGTTIWSQITKADGSREIHNYNGVSGKETSYQLYAADGSRTDANLAVTGKPYAGIVNVYNAAGKLTGTDTYSGAGKLISSDRWNADGSHTVYTIDATGTATGYKLYLANGTVTETFYGPKAPVVDVPVGSAPPAAGNGGQVPPGQIDVAAPKLAIASVGAAGADGSRHVLVTGTAKPGATVVIGDGTTVLATVKADAQGNLSADVKIPKGAETFLHATATDAAGNKGVPAIPITVEIGTAAEIVARLVTLTDQGNVSAVVLTDTNVLTIPTGQLAFFMRKAEAVLDKIQGTYSFLETGKVTGQSYDRQDVAYTSDGVITERLRYSNGVLTYDEKIASDGSREVAARNSKGGTDVTQYSKDGTLLRVDQYDAAHKIVFSQVKLPDGGQETYTYNATTGVLTNHTVYNADKSKVVEELGIVGRAYDKQVYVYDAAGKLIQQDRVEPDGTTIWSQITKADGSREIHNYNGVSGKETSYQLYAADGSRTDANLAVTGKPYAGIVNVYNAAGKLTGTDTYSGAGKLISSDRWNADGSHTVYTIDATGTATGYKLYLANGTVTETIYPVKAPLLEAPVSNGTASPDGTHTVYAVDATGHRTGFTTVAADGTKTAAVYVAGTTVIQKSEVYDASGRLVASNLFDTLGRVVSQELKKADGSTELHRFDVTGKETSFTLVSASGVRTEGTQVVVNRPYDKQLAVFDASNKQLEMDRWVDGKLVFSQKLQADGTTTVVSVAANGTKTIATMGADGKLLKSDAYDAVGLLTTSDVRGADGSKDVHRYDAAGKELGHTLTYADRSRVETTYDIQNRPYDKQSVHYDVAGKVLDMARWSGDKLVFQQTVHDGVTTVQNFDLAGRNTLIHTTFGDGTRDIQTFIFSADASVTQPLRVQEDHYAANGVKAWTDVTNANGVHEQTAHVGGTTLTSHTGVKDVFNASTGVDRFVFDVSSGNDVINRFATAGTSHDIIEIDHDFAAAFSDLAIVSSGADTIITLSPTDTITLVNVQASQLSNQHFLFV